MKKRTELTTLQKIVARELGQGLNNRQCAEKYGVTEQTICNWKNVEQFQAEMEKAEARVLLKLDACLPDIYDALVQSAMIVGPKGARDRVTALKVTGDLIDRSEMDHTHRLAEGRSLEELDHFARTGKWPEEEEKQPKA